MTRRWARSTASSLPHVWASTSITDACVAIIAPNGPRCRPRSSKRAYGSQDAYLKRYEAALDRLIADGYVLAADKAGMLKRAAELYQNPKGY